MYEFEYVFESINVAKSVLDECVCVFQRTLLSLSLSLVKRHASHVYSV